MCQVVNATSTYICHYDERQQTSTVIAEYMSSQANDKEQASDLGVSYDVRSEARFMQDFLAEGQPMLWYADDNDLSGKERQHYQQFGGCTVLAVPMRYASKIIAYAEIWRIEY